VYFIRLLLDKGLPPPSLRPALFIPVGSVAYTIVAIIGLANAIPEHGYFSNERHPMAKEICVVMALVVSVFMWLFSFWMFGIAVVGNVYGVKNIKFGLSWWAFIFPNVGFMLGTNAIGQELESEGILWVASAITVCLVAIWLVSAVGCIRAVWTGRIVWPGKDEDKDV
jgi:tellurite resistance protein TehA-like permease